MTLKDFFTGQKSRFFWLNIIAMVGVVVLLITVTLYGVDSYTHHGEKITVPSVTGMYSSKAAQSLDEAGLAYEIVDSTYRKDMAPENVVEQSPTAGNFVKKGHIIYLTINQTKTPTIVLPDIADNASLRDAQAKLEALGIKTGPMELIPGEKDWVYGVKYKGKKIFAGDRIPSSATVVLIVGNGDGSASADSTSKKPAAETENEEPANE